MKEYTERDKVIFISNKNVNQIKRGMKKSSFGHFRGGSHKIKSYGGVSSYGDFKRKVPILSEQACLY